MSAKKNKGTIDVFAVPFEDWSIRDTTLEEATKLVKSGGLSLVEALHTKDKLRAVVSTHVEAADYMLRKRADNALENHVERALDGSVEYRDLLALMPAQTPSALESYQEEFPEHDAGKADEAINAHGVKLAVGQMLFHGGKWPAGKEGLVSTRPFSTSFCPQVALRNAEWRAKAYDANRVDLMVVRVGESATKAFAYRREGNHGNEKEVVFASGANLTRVRETHIVDLTVSKVDEGLRRHEKVVPAYLVEVQIG